MDTRPAVAKNYLPPAPIHAFELLYELGLKIGEGSFGEVYFAMKKSDTKLYVAKISKLTNPTERDLREFRIVASVDHEGIVRPLEYYFS